jgi:periplasmic protein CpxP/Spy
MKRTTFQSFTAFASMAVLGAALGAAPTRAQIAGGGGGRSAAEQQAQLDALAKAVGLSPDQVAQVRAIDADASDQMASARSAGGDPATVLLPQIASIRANQTAQIKALLTPSQLS